MSDELQRAIEQFLDDADDALSEYDQGYADADATLRRLRQDLADLREAAEE